MSVITTPTAPASRVSIVVTEACCAAVVSVCTSLVVVLANVGLVGAQATETAAVLRVQVRVTAKALLTLLTLKRRQASL
jgi:hypothetical protein